MFGYSQVPFDMFDSQKGSNSNYLDHSLIHHSRVEPSKEGNANQSELESKPYEADSLIDQKMERPVVEQRHSVEMPNLVTARSEIRFVQVNRYSLVEQVIEVERLEQLVEKGQSQLTSD